MSPLSNEELIQLLRDTDAALSRPQRAPDHDADVPGFDLGVVGGDPCEIEFGEPADDADDFKFVGVEPRPSGPAPPPPYQ